MASMYMQTRIECPLYNMRRSITNKPWLYSNYLNIPDCMKINLEFFFLIPEIGILSNILDPRNY